MNKAIMDDANDDDNNDAYLVSPQKHSYGKLEPCVRMHYHDSTPLMKIRPTSASAIRVYPIPLPLPMRTDDVKSFHRSMLQPL